MHKNKLHLQDVKLTLIGEGAYAKVFKYKDSFYNCYFALKRIKEDTDNKECERFKHEFELL